MANKEYEDKYDAMVKEHQEFLNREPPKKNTDVVLLHIVMVLMGVVLFVGITGISIYFGNVDFNYQLSKCDNMNSESSSYDFTHRVEVNADYNKDCFYIQNHPLARFTIVYGNALLTGILATIFIVLLFTLLELLKPNQRYHLHY